MICEKGLLDGKESGEPGIQADEPSEMEMQDLRAILSQDSSQTPNRAPSRPPRFFDYLDANVWQLEICAHGFGRLFEKAQDALPFSLAELNRQLACVCLRASNASRLDPKD